LRSYHAEARLERLPTDIDEASGERAISPTLENGRHAEPPDGKLKDNQVSALELALVDDDDLGKCPRLEGPHLLVRDTQNLGIGALAAKVNRPGHGFKPRRYCSRRPRSRRFGASRRQCLSSPR
jgi:hypothetical protein